jgi:hypothetical protein
MLRGRHLPAVAAAILVAGAIAGSAGTAATTSGFALKLSAPTLVNNAVVTVRVGCPASQSKCSGATLAYVPPEPNSRVPAFRSGMLIAPAQPFALKRGQSTTLRMPIPLSEIASFRLARRVMLQTYTLAGNPNTGHTRQVFKTGVALLARRDPRLYDLHRLRLRLVGLQLKRNQNRLLLTVECSGASSLAKASVFGGCEGLINVYGGTLNASPVRLVTLGGTSYRLKAKTTVHASVPLLKRRLAQVAHEPKPYLIVYSIASDRVDKLGAAQLVELTFAHQ